MTTPLEHSFKSRLRNIAKEKRIDPAQLWQNLVLERFLVRLSRSPYSSNFILKGGVLLAQYIELNRYTRDLDFLVQRISNKIPELERVLAEVIQMPIQDGFHFSELRVDPLPHIHMKYPGVRATMRSLFGKTRFAVNVDLGFGDVVTVTQRELALTSSSKGALFESTVEIPCYPKEFIFAEKLETVVYRKGDNSRMKDFHDLFFLVQDDTLDPFLTEQVVKKVFTHRETALNLPIYLSDEELLDLQRYWSAHVRGLPSSHRLPAKLISVIDEINSWLLRCPLLCGW